MIRFFLWHNIFREKTGGSFTTRCSAISAGVLSFLYRDIPASTFCSIHIFAVKKTYLRNIHCPADMSESKVTFCFTSYSVNAGSLQLRLNPYPLPLPAARPHAFGLIFSIPKSIACSVCTVDLASCSNVMQCKENFCSLTGLPLNFSERIHHVPSVSQAKVFYFTGRYLQLSVYSMSGNMLRTAQFYIK